MKRNHPLHPIVICNASYGNDSIAQLQWAIEHGLPARCEAHVAYADTGWAKGDWLSTRVEPAEAWARRNGFTTHRTQSVGFKELVRQRGGFPRHGMQFCTQVLKIEPLARLFQEIDPEKQAWVLIGKRRAESRERANTPLFIFDNPYLDGRTTWHPLAFYSHRRRDALVRRAGFDLLDHRSDECWTCVNANKGDLRRLAEDEDRVAEIEVFEHEMGFTSKDKPITMYRPYRHRGATGIRAAIRWAHTDRGGEFDNGSDDCGYSSAGCGL